MVLAEQRAVRDGDERDAAAGWGVPAREEGTARRKKRRDSIRVDVRKRLIEKNEKIISKLKFMRGSKSNR